MQTPFELPTDVVYLGREILGELSLCESREFLVTNSIGGYASSTLASSLTRSYHGLLIAALRPPLDRTLLLAKLNETVHYAPHIYSLSTDRCLTACKSPRNTTQTEAVSPAGFELLQSFRLEGTVPVFTYAFGDAILDKRVWLKHGQNTVYVTYHLRRANQAAELHLDALVNHRNHHARTSAIRPHFSYSTNVSHANATVSVLFTTPERQETALSMRVSRGTASVTNEWRAGFVLSEERARGLPFVDDNLHAATFIVHLAPGGHITFVASAESDLSCAASLDGEAELAMQHAYEKSLLQRFASARNVALGRRALDAPGRRAWSRPMGQPAMGGFRKGCVNVPPCILQLVLAADQFIISRAGGRSVVAGFHWFTDWARDVGLSFVLKSSRGGESCLLFLTLRFCFVLFAAYRP